MVGGEIRPADGAGQARMEEGEEGKEDVEYGEKGDGEKMRTGWVGEERRGAGRGGLGWEREGSRREWRVNRDTCGHLTTKNLAVLAFV